MKCRAVVMVLALLSPVACSAGNEPVSHCDTLRPASSKTAPVQGTVMWGADASGTWSFDARPVRSTPKQRASTFATGVLPVGDMAFMTSGWRVCLIDAHGRRVWSQRRDGGFFVPALSNGLLVAPNSSRRDTHLYAFNAATGRQRWSWTQPRAADAEGGHIGAPLVSGDRVVVAGSEGLFAIDARSGRTLWRDAEGADAPIVVRGDTVYARTHNGLRFVDAGSGVERVRVDDASQSVIAGSSFVYTENRTGVAAYDVDSGKLGWQTSVQVSSDKPAMTLADDVLAVVGFTRVGEPGINGKAVYGLDASTGKERWRYLAGGEGISSALAAARGVIYAGNSDGLLVAIDAVTGREIWKTRVEIETHLDPGHNAGEPKTVMLKGDVSIIMPGDGAIYTTGRSWRISDATRDGALFLYA